MFNSLSTLLLRQIRPDTASVAPQHVTPDPPMAKKSKNAAAAAAEPPAKKSKNVAAAAVVDGRADRGAFQHQHTIL